MPYVIGKTFGFAAAHHLPQLPDGHKCRRPHGHNYTVTVELYADELDGRGFVVDYAELAPFAEWLQGTLDHQDLNEVMAVLVPGEWATAEVLAQWLFAMASDLLPAAVSAVRVCETANTFAEYRP